MRKLLLLASLAIMFGLALVAMTGTVQASPAQLPAPQEEQEGAATAPLTETLVIPHLDEWLSSPHADVTAEAFRHWDADDPAEVPTSCAKCHSTDGMLDYLGADGTDAGVVDNAAAVGGVVSCVACHNDVSAEKDSVVMPSGIEITGLGAEATCMECHQGRQSKASVDESIAEAAVDDDTVSEDLGFLNIHYYAAAATKYGTLAQGGYEYDGLSYDGNFAHVEGFETCIDCHNSHTLEVKTEDCTTCHEDVETVEDIRDIRMEASQVDYDGDGDVEEGIYYELEGLQSTLFAAIQTYASEVAGTAIGYNAAAHPYFFADQNADGEISEDEAISDNGYSSWTPRLLRAAYNYQTSLKDPGAYVHGGKYIIELLYDSIADLNSALAEPVDMTAMNRIDPGHFAGSEEAFRHWDAEGAVPGTCAKCHSDSGLPTFLSEGVNVSVTPSNGLACATCHNDLAEFTVHEVTSVQFPSGAVVETEGISGLCMNCHQGRESTVSVNRLIGDLEDDATSDTLRFLNVHYFAAGATRYGTEAKGAYEYEGKEYVGFFDHVNLNECNDCHDTHSLDVDPDTCGMCHDVETREDLRTIRDLFIDWDGDGSDDEGLAEEIDTLVETLYATLQDYATNTAGTGIVYDNHSHPYFFVDTNGNGTADPEEVSADNRFNSWTPRLLRAAYNFQYASKDPGAFAHNGHYIVQVLQDSIEDLGGDVSGMERP